VLRSHIVLYVQEEVHTAAPLVHGSMCTETDTAVEKYKL
jgi:hypothetical protein